MGVLRVAEGLDGTEPRNQLASRPGSDPPSLAIATAFLDGALRLWDEDRYQAKSQVEIAAAMLRDVAAGDVSKAPLPDSAPHGCGLAPWQARKVEEMIDRSLGSKVRLSDCASTARLSSSHFSRAFKLTFGTTLCRYIRCRRIERAKQLMLQSHDSLSQSRIALACGFGDQAHYCRVFRDVVGTSPNIWRRHNML
jgi:AraC family transcriptional regulator